MAINLQEREWRKAHWLVARLCEEAGVCLHDEEGNSVQIHAATYDVISGLLVQDEAGNRFRLRVTEEPLKLYGCCDNAECEACHGSGIAEG